MGVVWAIFSVILVSAAQLALGYAMRKSVSPVSSSLPHLLTQVSPLLVPLLLGLLCYLASTICWFFALRRLPLSRAYALLSLSYILVWGISLWLPGGTDVFTWRALAGVVAIMAGVSLIFGQSRPAAHRQTHKDERP